MHSNKRRYLPIVVLLLTLFLGGACYAQMDISGIGLSGSDASLVRAVTYRDTIYVIVSFTSPAAPVVGVATDSIRNFVRLHYYTTAEPELDPIDSQLRYVDTVRFQGTTLRFKLPMSGLHPFFRSLQIELGLWGVDGTDTVYSDVRSSHIPIGTVGAVHNSVDGRHATFLFVDLSTSPPHIQTPVSGQTISRFVNITYTQPEIAARGTLYLQIVDHDTNSFETHLFYLRDRASGTKAITLDLLSLSTTFGCDTIVETSTVLRHNTLYDFSIVYQDTMGNASAGDTIRSVLVDIRTEQVQLISPTLGSYAAYPNIRVIYDLGETAQSVQLTFREDTSATKRDTLRSPHIITLTPAWNSPGQTSFFLDGNDIGTHNSQYVLQSNRGPLDSLKSQAVYFVTISYGDTMGNPAVSDSTWGYVWPSDSTTIRPIIYDPKPGTAQNQDFWFRFKLPEDPAPGSIRLHLEATGGDPGSPHILYLKQVPAGITGTFLNGAQLDHSVLVDSLGSSSIPYEARNRLVNNVSYRLRFYYRDILMNPEIQATYLGSVKYDIGTRPITITLPAAGDSFRVSGTVIQYSQPEKAAPRTLQLSLTWTDGPTYDPASPHILYIANRDTGATKSLGLLPTAPGSTAGIDSANNNSSLIARSHYALSFSYQDSLLNPPAVTQVANLYMPSGTSVYAEGGGFGSSAVVPGVTYVLVFHCTLHSLSGSSILRAMHFLLEGTITSGDLALNGIVLWSSVDTMFDSNLDTRLVSLSTITGTSLDFSGFIADLDEAGTTIFLTFSYRVNANANHFANLLLTDPSSIDCGGDPILADRWPIGIPDVPLNAELLNFSTQQDSLSGALIVLWEVASENNNRGFNLYRKLSGPDAFANIASYTSSPELVGHGTSTSGWVFRYTDRTVTPGQIYVYRLESVSMTGVLVEYDLQAMGTPLQVPLSFSLGNAFPNPFNQSVTIEYTIPYTVGVKLIIYDLLGKKVKTLVNHTQPASIYRVSWDSKDEGDQLVPSGVYFYRLETDQGYFKTRKLLLIR